MVDFKTRLSSMFEEDRTYWLKHLPKICANPKQINRLFELLTSFDFLTIKITEIGIQDAIRDFDLLSIQYIVTHSSYSAEIADALRKIQKALQQSASIIEEDSQELPSRLWGHLDREQSPWIQKLLEQAIESKTKSDKPCWLRPLEANLSVPDTPLETTLTGHSGGVKSLALTSDGGTLVSGSDKQIKIWDIGSLTPRHTINFDSSEIFRKYDILIFNGGIGEIFAYTRYINALAITSDDSILISGSSDGVLRVWDLHSRQLLKRLEIILSQFVEFDEDHLHEYINLSRHTNKPINPYNAINSLAAIPGTHFVVVGCKDGFVFLYDIDRGTLHFNYRHDEPVHAAITSADGELIVTGAEESIIVCDMKKGNTLTFQTNMNSFTLPYFPHAGCSRNLAITLDKSKLLTTTPYMVYVWDLQSYKCLFELGHSNRVKSATLTPDGKKIIVGQALGDVVVWDISKGIPTQVPKVQPPQPKKGLFSKLRNIFISPVESEQIEEERPLTGEKIATLKGHAYHVDALTVTPDGKYAISGAEEVKLWRLDRLEQASESLAQHGWSVLAVAVSPDRRYFASTEGNRIKIWDFSTRKPIHEIHTVNYLGNGGCLLITPDSQRLIAGSLEAINFYNLQTGEKEDSVTVQGSLISALAMSSDGKRLISGGDHQSGIESGDTLRIWDIGSSKAKQIGALFDSSNDESVQGVAITPDGKQALSVMLKQNHITAWDLDTKEIIRTIPPQIENPSKKEGRSISNLDKVEFNRMMSWSINRCYSPFALTPDGNYLIATSALFFSVIHLGTGQKIVEVPPSERYAGNRHHHSLVTDIAVAPNGQWFVSTSEDATVKVWELPTGHNLATFSGESNPFTCCTVASDNCTIIAGDTFGQVHFFKFEGFIGGRTVLSPPIIPSLDASESASLTLNYPATTSESLPTKIRQDIESKEEYYKNSLENSLSNKNWQEANSITFEWLSDIMHEENSEKLHLLDSLWLKYSDNHFGFSVQKRIWEEAEQNPERFCRRVGWNGIESVSDYKSLIDFSLNAPEGHLPIKIDGVERDYGNFIDGLKGFFLHSDFLFYGENHNSIQLKKLPGQWVYLKLQVIGSGILELRLYLDDRLFLRRELVRKEDKKHDLDIIQILLPATAWNEKISGSLILKSLSGKILSSPFVLIRISCCTFPNKKQKVLKINQLYKKGALGLYRLLELQKELLGKDHPYVLATLDELAQRCKKNGRYSEAQLFKNQIKITQNNIQTVEIGNNDSKIIVFLSPSEIDFSSDINEVE